MYASRCNFFSLLPAHIWAAYRMSGSSRPPWGCSASCPGPAPAQHSASSLCCRAARDPGPPVCHSSPGPPSAGTTLPIFTWGTFYLSSERLSSESHERNLLTGGSILSWVCTGGKRKAWGGEGEQTGTDAERQRHSSRTPSLASLSSNYSNRWPSPKCLLEQNTFLCSLTKGKEGQRAET